MTLNFILIKWNNSGLPIGSKYFCSIVKTKYCTRIFVLDLFLFQCLSNYFNVNQIKFYIVVVAVVVAHIYPPVTGQRQTLTCWTIRRLFIRDYFVIGGYRTCLGVSYDPMFLWISSSSCPLNLLLV